MLKTLKQIYVPVLIIMMTLFAISSNYQPVDDATEVTVKLNYDKPETKDVVEGPPISVVNKGLNDFSLSDHTFDFKNVIRTNYDIYITGEGRRNIVIKGLRGTKESPVNLRFDATIRNSGTSVTIKFSGGNQYIRFDGTGGKLYGSGNSASQMVYIEADFNKGFEIIGLYINQGRNGASGSTAGGAAVQYSGSYSSACNATNFFNDYMIYRDLTIENANDEGIYHSHFTGLASSGTGGRVTNRTGIVKIYNCSVINSGRDFYQVISGDSVFIYNNKGTNGGLEQEPNHISAISYNGSNKFGYVYNNTFTNIPQFIFSGTEGVGGYLDIRKNTYVQGTHAGNRSNQAAYLRRDNASGTTEQPSFTYILEENNVNAPAAKIAVISVDKAPLTHRKNTLTGPKEFRILPGATVTYTPRIKNIVVTQEDIDYYDEITIVTPLNGVTRLK